MIANQHHQRTIDEIVLLEVREDPAELRVGICNFSVVEIHEVRGVLGIEDRAYLPGPGLRCLLAVAANVAASGRPVSPIESSKLLWRLIGIVGIEVMEPKEDPFRVGVGGEPCQGTVGDLLGVATGHPMVVKIVDRLDVEAVEASGVSREAVLPELVLAHNGFCPVAVFAQDLRQRRAMLLNVECAVEVLANRRDGAGRGGRGAQVGGPRFEEAVDEGRGVPRVAVDSQVVGTQGVDGDEKNVGRRGRGIRCRLFGAGSPEGQSDRR